MVTAIVAAKIITFTLSFFTVMEVREVIAEYSGHKF